MATDRGQSQDFAVLLWFLSAVLFALALIVPEVSDDVDQIWLRTGSVMAIFMIPTGIFFLWSGWRWQEVIGTQPDSASLVLSVVAGAATWIIAWWLMLNVQVNILAAAVDPPAIYAVGNWAVNWEVLIIVDVLLIPLLTAGLLWGGLRMAGSPFLSATIIMLFGVISGVSGMILGGIGVIGGGVSGLGGLGVAGFFGYALVGALAGYLCMVTGTAWPGVMMQGTFAYLNFRFYDTIRFDEDNLQVSRAGVVLLDDFFTTEWLVRILVASFVILIAVQLIRVRHGLVMIADGEDGDEKVQKSKPEQSSKPFPQAAYIPTAILMVVTIFSFWRIY